MRTIFAALTKELGEVEGRSVFEWYCSTYKVTISDIAPDTVVYEVLGITKEENEAGVVVENIEGDKYRATDLLTGLSITFTAGSFNSTQKPEIPAAYTDRIAEANIEAGEAASATAGAMCRIGAFLALHCPELAGVQ